MRLPLTLTLLLFASLVPFTPTVSQAQAPSSSGSVYIMTNRAEGNSVLVYKRASDGSLTFSKEVSTHGLGPGLTLDPLQSQGSLSLSNDGKLLLAVNAASGTLTAFVVNSTGISFGSKMSSAGALPVSVTDFGGLVYVLNQLGSPSIVGFTVDGSGHLQRISGSSRGLAGGALSQPAQVSFTPDGKKLLVTEKGTDLIDVFDVQGNGLTSTQPAEPSSGHTPFGFAFGPSNTLVVTEAGRRFPNAATVSSYTVDSGLSSVSPAVADGQTAACWVTVVGNTAYVVNTGTANISAYSVDASGHLSLANAVAASTGADTSPIDLAASSDGQFVYVLKSATGSVAGYRVNGDKLDFMFEKTGLPLSIQGIAAR